MSPRTLVPILGPGRGFLNGDSTDSFLQWRQVGNKAFGQAEIRDDKVTSLVDEDVPRFDISVNNAVMLKCFYAKKL